MYENIKLWVIYSLSILFVIHSFNQIIFAREKVQDLEKLNIKWGMTKEEFMKNRPDVILDKGSSIVINLNYIGHKIEADLFFTMPPYKKYPDYLSMIRCFFGFKEISHQSVITAVRDFREFNQHLTKVNGEPQSITNPCQKKEDYYCYLTALKRRDGFNALWEIDMTDINNNHITLEIVNGVSILENKIYHHIHFMIQ